MNSKLKGVDARLTLSKQEFFKIKEIFEEYPDLDAITISQSSLSGIGTNTTVEFKPTASIMIDITDTSAW